MNLRLLRFSLGLSFLAACGTTVQFAPTNPSPRALSPRPPETVQIYTTGTPDEPYAEVGILQARQASTVSFDEFPDVIAEMREEAAQIGCDGVIITSRADATTGSTFGNGNGIYGETETLEGVMGTCIVYVGG
jgi:hypothetical protein